MSNLLSNKSYEELELASLTIGVKPIKHQSFLMKVVKLFILNAS
jgi:hypothetical protein